MILNSKIIICAGGNGGAKWNMYLGITKHMILAHDEPLIHRTQRQLLERGFTNVYLACSPENKEEYLLEGIKYISSPPMVGHVGEKSSVWHYRKFIDYDATTIMAFGDVYYTDELMDTLTKDPNDTFKIYGRSDASTVTNNWRQGEPFFIVLHKDWIAKYFQALKQTMIALPVHISKRLAIPEDLAKYIYRKVVGIPYEAPGNVVEHKHWHEWDDLTDDFDDPDDWKQKSSLFPEIFTNKKVI